MRFFGYYFFSFSNYAKIKINFYTLLCKKMNCLKKSTNGWIFEMNKSPKLENQGKMTNFDALFK